MSAAYRGRRLPNCIGGSRHRCAVANCAGGLSCLAGHPTNSKGDFLSFGFGAGGALEVRLSTVQTAGLGLFALAPFKADEVITTYDGHVSHKLFVPNRASEAGVHALSHLHSIPHTEFVVWGFRVPTWGRGLGSFANHAQIPNAKVVTRPLQFPYVGIQSCPDLRSHLVLKAVRQIHSDEEIFISYPPNTLSRLGIQ